jgi:hypothetical protein
MKRRPRSYSRQEMARIRCAHDPSWVGPAKKRQCEERVHAYYPSHPRWWLRRLPVPLVAYDESACGDRLTAKYTAMRQAGSRFPPILALPSKKRPGTWWADDGNHRVCAAVAVGDASIEAFVPV